MKTPTHNIPLSATVHLAKTMLTTQQPLVTMSDSSDGRTLRFMFASSQQIIGVVRDARLIDLQVTLKAGMQPSIKALEDALQAKYEVPLFDARLATLYQAASYAEQTLMDDPAPLQVMINFGGHSKMLGEVLNELVRITNFVDGKTDHYHRIAQMISSLKTLVAA